MEAKNDSKNHEELWKPEEKKGASGNEEKRFLPYNNLGTTACAASRILSLTNEVPSVLGTKIIHL